MSGLEWIARVDGAVRFGADVPRDVREADFALDQFCIQKESVVDREPFFARLKRLRAADLIGPLQYNRWDGLRSLRNAATHPRFVEQLSPAMAFDLIKTVAEAINALPWTRGRAGAS